MVKLGSRASTLAGYMSPGNLSVQQRRIVQQALVEVVPQAEADAILKRALAEADLPDVPSQLTQLSIFLFGALHAAIEKSVGAETARRVVDQLQAVVDASITETEEGPDAVATAASPSKSLVLVVDPDVSTRSQVVLILKKNGHAAVSAPDDNVALAMCVRYRPGVVVAGYDVQKGQQLAALLRVAFGEEAPPMVLLGVGEASGGVRAVVAKPVTEAELMTAVKSVG